MQKVALIDYGSGNLRSAERALNAAAEIAGAPTLVTVTASPGEVAAADRIVLPGQGAFDQCMAGLLAVPGMADALRQAVIAEKKPFLGICVGMQLLLSDGFEHGRTEGLGWIAGACTKLDTSETLPHMGWNEAAPAHTHPVLAPDGPHHYYFAHSYVARPDDPDAVILSTEHGAPFPAAIAKDNLLGVQFHPEKSQAAGLQLLARFLTWTV